MTKYWKSLTLINPDGCELHLEAGKAQSLIRGSRALSIEDPRHRVTLEQLSCAVERAVQPVIKRFALLTLEFKAGLAIAASGAGPGAGSRARRWDLDMLNDLPARAHWTCSRDFGSFDKRAIRLQQPGLYLLDVSLYFAHAGSGSGPGSGCGCGSLAVVLDESEVARSKQGSRLVTCVRTAREDSQITVKYRGDRELPLTAIVRIEPLALDPGSFQTRSIEIRGLDEFSVSSGSSDDETEPVHRQDEDVAIVADAGWFQTFRDDSPAQQ